MSTQPEALRLAEFYEALAEEPPKSPDNSNIRAVAAELRRLHAEVERLSWDSIHTCHSECHRPLCKLTRERDALLEALKYAEAGLADIGDADREPGDDLAWCEARAAQALPLVRAAIKAVEEGK